MQQVADAQDGLIRTEQLSALGFSSAALARRVKYGRLHPVFRGVYAVGRSGLSQRGEFRAAALAIGADAVVSHFACAAHYAVWKGNTKPIDVTVPRRLASRTGIRVHCVPELPETAITVHDGLRVTTPERMIIDLAAKMYSQRRFRRLVHECEVRELTDPDRLRLEIARCGRRPGVPRVLAEISDGAFPTRSGDEDDLVVILRANNFPRFVTNARPPGTPAWVEVDVLFPEQRLVIELDGGPWHKTGFRRELDAYKSGVLDDAHYSVLRLSDDDTKPAREPDTVAKVWDALRRCR